MVATIEADLDHGAALRSPDLEAVNAALVRLKDAAWAVQRDRLRTAREVAELAGPEPESGRHRRVHVDPGRAVRARPPRGARARLGRHPPAGPRPRPRPRVAGAGRAARRPLERPAVRVHVGPCRGRVPQLRLQGGGRDRRAGRQHAGAPRRTSTATPSSRRRSRATRAQAVVLGHTRWASVGIISQPNAHPLNAEEIDRVDGPYVAAALNGDVDNFADLKTSEGLRIAPEITTDAKVIPTLVSRRLASGDRARRRLPSHGRRARRLGRHRGQRGGCARRPAARPAGQRPGALRRPGRRADARRLRAVRPGGGVRSATSASTARPRPTSATRWAVARAGGPPRRGGRRHPRGHHPLELRRPDVAGLLRGAAVARDHHPRHRPGRPPALPAQGDHRGAGVVPQDAPGQARRAGRRARRVRSAPTPCRSTCGTA